MVCRRKDGGKGGGEVLEVYKCHVSPEVKTLVDLVIITRNTVERQKAELSVRFEFHVTINS